MTLYGIVNCDTVKKARAWLDGRGVAYVFHDYKKSGIDPARLDQWIGKLGGNRCSTGRERPSGNYRKATRQGSMLERRGS